MALLTIPKVWSSGEIPTAADLNAVFAAIAASVNAITNAQIAPTAGISGTKIGTLGTANFEDEAVTQPKLAVGAATVSQDVQEATAQSQAITGTEVNVATRVLTRAGGGMLLFGTVVCEITPNGSPVTVRARFLDGASPLGVAQSVPSDGAGATLVTVQLAVAQMLSPASGAKTFHLGVTRTVGTAGVTATGWQLATWELR